MGSSPARTGPCPKGTCNGPATPVLCMATRIPAFRTHNARIPRKSQQATRWEPIFSCTNVMQYHRSGPAQCRRYSRRGAVESHGKPGEVGNLGFNNFSYFGNWTLDMGISKTFKMAESKSIQVRIDASNVFNHPTPVLGNQSFTTGQFGVVTNKTDERALQGQLRISF